jgi:peptidoglycan hydrolase-like protein with peptidoglycan-binding domain
VVTISASVGQGGVNKSSDVLKIQQALNKIPANQGGPIPLLKEDGYIGPKTIGAITKFQKENGGLITDGRVDVNGPTLARINAILSNSPTPTPGPTGPKFTDKNLYGPNGPSSSDIKQDAFGDCYFVATLGAVADQNPKLIQDAIYYDAFSTQFRVKLHDLSGKPKYIWVTQAELEDNVNRQGGSWVDNTGLYERTWPAVMETAYAKMFDKNHKNGLGEGYSKIINGGWPSDAMIAITGSAGNQVTYAYYLKLGTAGSVAVLGSKVAVALEQRKSVTLWSVPEKDSRTMMEKLSGKPIPQDGLVDDHVYTVLKTVQKGTDWDVTVRNPWGTNMGVGEGMDTTSPTLTISLQALVATGGLQAFQVSN